MKRFGLIGFPVGHSFSKKYFTEKFEKLKLKDHIYDLYEMEFLHELPSLWMRYPDLIGINVTVPHKEGVIEYLDQQDASSVKVGAINVILKKKGNLIGFNTDYLAFKESFKNWVNGFQGKALILGSGGASKAVQAALSDLGIPFNTVSRASGSGGYTYEQINKNKKIIEHFKLIINTTPLGMYPNENECPDIPYEHLSADHLLYDLVYNPRETKFMSLGMNKGAQVKNGMEMLELQAEKSWDIWSN
ncbi:MAG: shikimate dehydrogenase [Ekhidna sp.]|nr:shikimate dehydrogenase [Ekhidna sp.]MBC6410768.1 shikimate dehydrogenase [Ekhidna sp.]MBC6427606.1 shikimate dehydrogenase [Ekhidna sp.]